MRNVSISILFFIVMCTSCNKDSNIVKGFYDSMHFVRLGWGQIDFTLYSTDNPYKYNAIVTKYNNRVTTLQIIIEANNDDSTAFLSLNQALNNQIQINGDFQRSALETESEAFIYLVNDNKETEVTNTELINSLLEFEQRVRDKIQ